jgi:hypothetical protein
MKTAVDTIFVGKDRLYNRRFLQMCSQPHAVPRTLSLLLPLAGSVDPL